MYFFFVPDAHDSENLTETKAGYGISDPDSPIMNEQLQYLDQLSLSV